MMKTQTENRQQTTSISLKMYGQTDIQRIKKTNDKNKQDKHFLVKQGKMKRITLKIYTQKVSETNERWRYTDAKLESNSECKT